MKRFALLLLTMLASCQSVDRERNVALAPVELTAGNWRTEVEQSQIPVLVDFWAAWCGPCRQLSPTIDKLAADYAGRVKVGKLDVDKHKTIAKQFNVSSIPAVLIFSRGKEVKRFVGVQSEATLSRELNRLVK